MGTGPGKLAAEAGCSHHRLQFWCPTFLVYLTDMGLVDVDNFCFTEMLYGQPPTGTEPCGACR